MSQQQQDVKTGVALFECDFPTLGEKLRARSHATRTKRRSTWTQKVVVCIILLVSARDCLSDTNSVFFRGSHHCRRNLWGTKARRIRERVGDFVQSTRKRNHRISTASLNVNAEDISKVAPPLPAAMDRASSWLEDRNTDKKPKPILPLFAGAIDSITSDPGRLARWSWKGVQYYFIWTMVRVAWKTLTEVVEELAQEGLGSSESHFCSRSDLQRLLQCLENPSPSSSVTVPRAAAALATDLLAVGLPIRTPPQSGRTSIESLFQDLTTKEASILQQCLWKPPRSVRQQPGELWNSVLGLDEVKERLLLTVAASAPANSDYVKENNLLKETQEAFAPLLGTNSASSHYHGILLFGEPGCGKSCLAQALSAKLRWPCLVVTPSALMRKYVGESNQQVRALFSLLQNKLSPCVVVLDELDGLFRERHDIEHDAAREFKTEFLQWLSGIMTSSSTANNNKESTGRQPVIVIGASNRPFDVDSAILRRLPQRFYVGLPDFSTRCQLIQGSLKGVPLEKDFKIDFLAHKTEGYSPSDIKQALEAAARSGPIRDAIINPEGEGVRPLTTKDVLDTLSLVHATPLSRAYREGLSRFMTLNDGNNNPQNTNPPQIRRPLGPYFANVGTYTVPPYLVDSLTPPFTQQQRDDTNEDTDVDEEEEDDEYLDSVDDEDQLSEDDL